MVDAETKDLALSLALKVPDQEAGDTLHWMLMEFGPGDRAEILRYVHSHLKKEAT